MLVGFFFRFKATVPLNGDAEGNRERYRRFISGFSHSGFCTVKVGSATEGIQPQTGRKGGNGEESIHKSSPFPVCNSYCSSLLRLHNPDLAKKEICSCQFRRNGCE